MRILVLIIFLSGLSYSLGLTSDEQMAQDIFTKINECRQNPATYKAKLEAMVDTYSGTEGVSAVNEAITALGSQATLPVYTWSPELARSAEDHVADYGANGGFSSTDGSTLLSRIQRYGTGASNMYELSKGGSLSDAEDIVHSWLISDNDSNRNGRNNLLSTTHTTVGIAYGDHVDYTHCLTMDMADSISAKTHTNGCTGATDLKFYTKCKRSCPEDSTETSTVCTCDAGKAPSSDGETCVDACTGSTPFRFYTICVDSCPTGSTDTAGVCICTSGVVSIAGDSCLDACAPATPKHFYSQCMDQCPADSSAPPGFSDFCVCDSPKIPSLGETSCIDPCSSSTPLNFYGVCKLNCPTDSSETGHAGFCTCEGTKISSLDKSKCEEACPTLRFYEKCVTNCPTDSSETANGVTHTGYCVCGFGKKLSSDGNSCEDACVPPTPLTFYTNCVSACPADSTEATSECTCNSPKIPSINIDSCIDPCPGSTPKNFYSTCLASCPTYSSEYTNFVHHPGFCTCQSGKTKSLDGGSCEDTCIGSTALRFYSKCVGSCPTDSSSTSTPGYCLCSALTKLSLDGNSCVPLCDGGKKDFYGNCLDSCPTGSTEDSDGVFCTCDGTTTHNLLKDKCVTNTCTTSSNSKNFYEECMGSCPTGSAETTNGVAHPGYCKCLPGKMRSLDGKTCVSEVCSTSPDLLNFYGSCVSACPSESAQITNNLPHPGFCICNGGKGTNTGKTACIVVQLNDLEMALGVADIMSKIRTHPTDYVPVLTTRATYFDGNLLKIPGRITLITNEGVSAVNEAITYLNAATALDGLSLNPELTHAALDHNTDLGTNGITGHTGSDGSSMSERIQRYATFNWAGEVLAYGNFASAEDIVLAWIVDDGVSSRGHRTNIFSSNAKVVGVAYGDHASNYQHTCSADLGGTMTPKTHANGCVGATNLKFIGKCVEACPTHSTASSTGMCECETSFEENSSGNNCVVSTGSTLAPRPLITGGGQTFYSNAQIELSGKDSVNPNNEDKSSSGLSFLWECYIGGTKGCGADLSDSTDMNYQISPNSLVPGTYILKLTTTVTGSALTASIQSTIVIIEAGTGPLVKINGMLSENAINPEWDTKLHITFLAPSSSTGTASAPSDATYQWSVTPSITGASGVGAYFTILKGSMTSGVKYILQCIVTHGGSTTASTEIHVAGEVKKGKLEAGVTEGEGYNTVFKFTASEFAPEDLLLYKFMYRIEGTTTEQPLTTKYLSTKIFEGKLVHGRESQGYKVNVIVIAKDLLGMTARAQIAVVVKPASAGYDNTFVTGMLNEADKEQKLVNLGQVSSLTTEGKEEVDISSKTGPCRECSPTNGKCGLETNYICECLTDQYALPFCTYTKAKSDTTKQIMRTVADSIDSMYDTATEPEEKLALLSSAEACSAGSTLGDKEGNEKLEKVEKKMVESFEKGELNQRESGESLLRFISNSWGGVNAEMNSVSKSTGESGESGESTTSTAELDKRGNERMRSLKRVFKIMMKLQAVGTRMLEQRTDNFEVTGTVNKCGSLGGTELETENGPKVKLPIGIGGSVNINRLVTANYINIKTNRHYTCPYKPVSNVVDVELNDYETGETVPVSDLEQPVEMEFETGTQEVIKESPPTCVFYSTSLTTYVITGVSTIKITTSSRGYRCSSDHLTEFTLVPYALDDTNQNEDEDDDGNNTALIIGICIGVVLASFIIIIGLCCYFKSRKRTSEKVNGTDMESKPDTISEESLEVANPVD